MGRIKDCRDGFKEWFNRPPVCPRCLTEPTDVIFLGSESEGHICGKCWTEDREREGTETIFIP